MKAYNKRWKKRPNSLEANHDLQESVKSYKDTLYSFKNQYQTLEGEKTLLQQELNSARQLNTQINERKNETQKSLNTISLQNRTQAFKIKDLETIQKNLKQKVDHLQLKIKDLEEREKVYREAEELYEQNFRPNLRYNPVFRGIKKFNYS